MDHNLSSAFARCGMSLLIVPRFCNYFSSYSLGTSSSGASIEWQIGGRIAAGKDRGALVIDHMLYSGV